MLTLESGTVIYFGRHEYSQPISISAPFSGIHQTNSHTNFSAGVQASNFVHLLIPLISKYVLVVLVFGVNTSFSPTGVDPSFSPSEILFHKFSDAAGTTPSISREVSFLD